jgi:4-amino-4-deoxy-L-arabinose transferase-like glycosyltransferase
LRSDETMTPRELSAPRRLAGPSVRRTVAARTGARGIWWLFVALAVYFGLHILTRSLVSNSLQRDEAEQLLLTQDWKWGYGSQPPLYTWTLNILFAGLGVNVFTLALLKNVLLLGIYVFVFLSAWEIFREPRTAALAAATLLLFPNIAWESQRDQTHLVLATAISAVTLFAFLRLLKTGSLAWYAASGALVGLGALSKYNYLFFPVSLVLAALSIPRFRPLIFTWKSLIALAVLAAVTTPHIIWFLRHQALAYSQSYKFKMALAQGGVVASLEGPSRLFLGTCAFVVVPVLIYSPLLYRAFRANHNRPVPDESPLLLQLLQRATFLGVLLSLGAILAFRVTFIQYRWEQPLLFAVPILLVGWGRSHLDRAWTRTLFRLCGVVAFTVLVALNGTVVGANLLHRANNLNIPYPAIAGELRKAGFQKGTIIASTVLLGGNLRMQFKDSRFIVEEVPPYPPLAEGPKLVVWDANQQDQLPGEFLKFALDLCGTAQDAISIHYVELPSRNGDKNAERIGFILIPDTRK